MPEFGRDDFWLFVFQDSFVSQRWKLAEKCAKNACIFCNAFCAEFLRKFKIHTLETYYNQRFINYATEIFRKDDSFFSLFLLKKKQNKKWLKTEMYFI